MIDIATMAPRSQEASQVQNNTMRHQENAQIQTGQQFSQEVQHDSQQTVETNKDEWPEYQYGESKGNHGGNPNQRRRQKSEDKDEAPMAPRSTSSFDITI